MIRDHKNMMSNYEGGVIENDDVPVIPEHSTQPLTGLGGGDQKLAKITSNAYGP